MSQLRLNPLNGRWVTIVADRWWGLVTTLAMSSVSVGYGTDGSSTPTITAFAIAATLLACAGTLRAQHAITDELRPLPSADRAPVVALRAPAGPAEAPALRLWQNSIHV